MDEIFKKTNKKLILTSIIFIIILVSVIILQIMINKTADNAVELRQELVNTSGEDIVTLKRAIRNFENHKDVIDNLILDKDKAFVFISNIEQLSKDSGLNSSVDSISLSDVLKSGEIIPVTSKDAGGPKRSYGQLNMVISVDGEWNEIISFLIKLENIPQQAVIDALRLSSVFDQTTKKTSWKASFNILATTN